MDGGDWWAAVHGVSKSWTRLNDFTFTFYFHALEREMVTHSSVLAWRIPGTGKPGGLLSVGSQRVRHDWSDLAAAAAAAAGAHPCQMGRFITWQKESENVIFLLNIWDFDSQVLLFLPHSLAMENMPEFCAAVPAVSGPWVSPLSHTHQLRLCL